MSKVVLRKPTSIHNRSPDAKIPAGIAKIAKIAPQRLRKKKRRYEDDEEQKSWVAQQNRYHDEKLLRHFNRWWGFWSIPKARAARSSVLPSVHPSSRPSIRPLPLHRQPVSVLGTMRRGDVARWQVRFVFHLVMNLVNIAVLTYLLFFAMVRSGEALPYALLFDLEVFFVFLGFPTTKNFELYTEFFEGFALVSELIILIMCLGRIIEEVRPYPACPSVRPSADQHPAFAMLGSINNTSRRASPSTSRSSGTVSISATSSSS